MSTEFIPGILCDNGYAADALKMMTNKEYPSLLNMIDTAGCGTTTESWEARVGRGDSLNHYAVGNATRWFFEYLGGIKPVKAGFEEIVIKALENGEVLRLKDIARIELGRLAYTFNNTVNGHKSVSCIVYQMAGTNATQTISDIEKLLEDYSAKLPSGLKINIAQNANDFLFASIHEVVKTLIEAFILVFIVVYIFLQDMRSTLIPAIAIPVALIATFFVLKLIGFSINLLTLSAMVLAIAIVVDDAIVVVEGVHAKLDQGYKSARAASIDAMHELGGAIVSITLVMMSVFIPVSFMGGTAGTFYRQFGLTMAIAIAFSAINALTLSPALCAIFLKPHNSEASLKERIGTATKEARKIMLARYADSLGRMMRPGITLIFTVIAILGMIFGFFNFDFFHVKLSSK